MNRFPLDYWLRVFGDFLTGFGRSMLIPFMLIFLKQEGGFETWVVTLLTAVPQLFQLFSTAWGGVLADQYGRKPIMFISLAGSGLVLSLMLSPNYWVVYAGYVLFLIMSNFYRPAAMAMITEVIPVESHRDAFAILRMMANLGFALGPLVGSLLFFTHRPIAITGSVLAYGITACSVFFMHETRQITGCSGSILTRIPNPFSTFSLLHRDMSLRWTVLTGVFFLMVQLQLFTSFTIVVNDTFMDNGHTLSFLLAINTIGVVLGQYFITSKTREVSFFNLLAAALVFSIVGWGSLLLPIGSMRFYVLLVLVTLAEMLMAAGYNPFIATLAKDGEIAQYMSFTQTSNILGQMIGPTIGAIGYDMAGQPGYVFILWGLLLVTGFSLHTLKRKYETAEHQYVAL